MRSHLRRTAILAAAAVTASFAVHGSAASPDPAARGLDAFVATGEGVLSGDVARLQIETYGFVTTASPTPLGGVTIEAAWDPRSLEPAATAPPKVTATSDKDATATLAIPVPSGDDRDLTLLLALRFGEHSRTRSLKVHRRTARTLSVGVADRSVVPGTTVAAWARAVNNGDGTPVAHARVRFKLLEGTYARHVLDAETDGAGWAVTRIPIPPSDDPAWSWALVAELDDPRVPVGRVVLTTRDETPGEPSARVTFDTGSVEPGKSVGWRIVARDGSGAPLANQTLRVWSGPTGTKPPANDADWDGVSTTVTTDGAGVAVGTVTAPTVVSEAEATHVTLQARLVVEGKALTPTATVAVGARRSAIGVTPEAGALVPGIAQALFVTVLDEKGKGVAGEIMVEGDGLHEKLVTDEHGEGELRWNVPKEIGARRDVGPCASGVAATIRLTPLGALPAFGASPHLECIPVDRDRTSLVRVDRPMVRVGETLKPVLDLASTAPPAPGPTSFTLEPSIGTRSNGWAAGPASLVVAAGVPGIWTVGALRPRPTGDALAATSAVMVLPKVLPRLTVRTTSVRAEPDGEVEVEATLEGDGHAPLAGSAQAVLIDLEGGGSLAGIEAADTRLSLCRSVGIEDARCDAFLSDDKALDPLRRAVLFGRASHGTHVPLDPGGTAKKELEDAFGDVLRSLEGALFEATSAPNRLVDVRRKGPGGTTFNPELLTLTTGAMSEPPKTPGGEVFGLPDLLAVDSQVTFDNVARRVTRLKLFRVLAAVRAVKHDKQLDDDEPIWKDPNALLRRMVRDGTLEQAALLDPWGGTLQFVTGNAGLPFISVVRGFTLASPGPDGVLGTGDDLKDPFARVVKSGTPYANAMKEDELVDAKYDMQVSDATVDAWRSTIEAATGTALGDGLHGSFGTGSGQGFGSGHGALRGGAVRVTPQTIAHSWISERLRFDSAGKVRFKVPLGPIETRWGIGVLADADTGEPASATLTVPVALPTSVTIESGGAWTEGDRAAARVLVRNRTNAPIHAKVDLSAKNAVSLASEPSFVVDVPAGGLVGRSVPLRALGAGTASLTAHLTSAPLPDDSVEATWPVLVAGETLVNARSTWVTTGATLTSDVPPTNRPIGEASLVLERGVRRSVDLALAALDPDRLSSPRDLLATIEAATRVLRWATTNEPAGSPRRTRAADVLERAKARLVLVQGTIELDDLQHLITRRLELVAPAPAPKPAKPSAVEDKCPPKLWTLPEDEIVASEPPPEATGALPCWDAYVSDAIVHARSHAGGVEVARLYLTLVDRAHRSAQAKVLFAELLRQMTPDADGAIALASNKRVDRAIVYSALVRGGRDAGDPAKQAKLLGWLLVQRDANGSFGDARVTREAIDALVAFDGGAATVSEVRVRAGNVARDVRVSGDDVVTIPLGPNELRATIEVRGAPLLATLMRPMLRPFGAPGELVPSPITVQTTWPTDAAVGKNLNLHVELGESTGSRGRVRVRARIPLPPGVTLAAAVSGVKQIGGALVVQVDLSSKLGIDVPVRFGLAGTMSTREPTAFAPILGSPRAVAPAETLVVR
jgi:hypothetical protein